MARTLTTRRLACAVAVALALQAHGAYAIGLVQAYNAALQNDPTYRSASFERDAGKESEAIGRSALLPSISASYSEAKNRAARTVQTVQGPFADNPDYTSKTTMLQVRQPIVNPEGYARYYEGIAQSKYSEAQFSGRKQDLIVRVVSAYSDAQFAEDQLMLARAQREAYAEQKIVNQRMFEKGEGTRTDVIETQAKFDLAEAQVLEAEENVVAARTALSAIIGKEITELDTLVDDFNLMPLQPATFNEWRSIALEQNTDIAAQRYAVEATQHEVDKNRAGHFPRMDMIASYSRATSDSISTLNQEIVTHSVGFQINIPIYSGGYVNAVTSQAAANHEKAKADLDDRTGKTLVDLRKQFNAVLSSQSRIPALNKAVESARLLIVATEQSVKGGQRINLDVLNAKQQWYAALRDLSQARYNYIVANLKLRYDAGVLSTDDLQKFARYFKPR